MDQKQTQLLEEMIARLRAGQEVRAMAPHLGEPEHKLYDLLYENGLKAKDLKPGLIPESRAREILRRCDRGDSRAAIARWLGVAPKTLLRWLARRGAVPAATRRPTPIAPEKIAEMCALHRDGWKQVEIGARFGCDQATVSRHMINNGHRCMNRFPARECPPPPAPAEESEEFVILDWC